MNPKLKKWLIRISIFGLGLLLFGYGFRDFWKEQIRIYVLGLVEVRSDKFGWQLPNIDEIEVMALGEPNFTESDGPDRFAHYAITGRATLRDGDAETIVKLWRSLRRGRGFSAMCHNPGYALQFRQHGELMFETTICWECNNYTIPIGFLGRIEYGFDSTREDAQSLLALLQSHAPLPEVSTPSHEAVE